MDLLFFNHFDECVRLSGGRAVRHPPLQTATHRCNPISSELCSKGNHFVYWKARTLLSNRVWLDLFVWNSGQGLNQSMRKESRSRRADRAARVAFYGFYASEMQARGSPLFFEVHIEKFMEKISRIFLIISHFSQIFFAFFANFFPFSTNFSLFLRNFSETAHREKELGTPRMQGSTIGFPDKRFQTKNLFSFLVKV